MLQLPSSFDWYTIVVVLNQKILKDQFAYQPSPVFSTKFTRKHAFIHVLMSICSSRRALSILIKWRFRNGVDSSSLGQHDTVCKKIYKERGGVLLTSQYTVSLLIIISIYIDKFYVSFDRFFSFHCRV
jgi:hypothetical protein